MVPTNEFSANSNLSKSNLQEDKTNFNLNGNDSPIHNRNMNANEGDRTGQLEKLNSKRILENESRLSN